MIEESLHLHTRPSLTVPGHPSREPACTSHNRVSSLFASSGGMGRVCREVEGAKTPLGPVEDWPHPQCTSVALDLGSGFPMIPARGANRIQIDNDAYIPLRA